MILEKRNVPTPAPQTVTPVASARYFSKYMVTITIAGQYMRPNPVPMTIPTEKVKNPMEVALYDMAHLKIEDLQKILKIISNPMEAIMAPIIVVILHPILLHIAEARGPVANISPVSSDNIHETSAFVPLNS